jgi:hypothetical protein
MTAGRVYPLAISFQGGRAWNAEWEAFSRV